MQTLVDRNTRKQISIGDTVKTFRGEDVEVIDMRPPSNGNPFSGRVYIQYKDGIRRESFPGTVNAMWI